MQGPSAMEMANVQRDFLEKHAPQGPDRLMSHEGTQLAIALGMSHEGMDVVMQDWVFIPSKDVPGQMVSAKSVLDEACPPLQQIFWKDSPLNITVVLPVGELGLVPMILDWFCKDLQVGLFHVLVLSDMDALLFERGSALLKELPWKVDSVVKVYRYVATTSGSHLQPWLLTSNGKGRVSGADPTFKITRLLSPGAEPHKLFVNVPAQPEDLWAFSVHFGRVQALLQAAGVPADQAVVLPRPLARSHR